jgi:hypothetical protein
MAKTNKTTAPATATVRAPEPVAPKNRRSVSRQDHPVAYAWVTCYNMVATSPEAVPARKAMITACMGEHRVIKVDGEDVDSYEVAYYTARTQVQKFRQWLADGAPADKLPKAVHIG